MVCLSAFSRQELVLVLVLHMAVLWINVNTMISFWTITNSNPMIIERRKCVVVEVTSVKVRSMALKCHNPRLAALDTQMKDLGSLLNAHPLPFHIVIEKSNLRTTPSLDVLSRFPLSPISLMDDRLDHVADVNTAATVLHLMDMIPVPRSSLVVSAMHCL